MKPLLAAMSAVFLLISQTRVACDEALPKRAGQFDEDAFGQLPVQFNGRVTNFDQYARNALLRISGRDTWTDSDGESQPAILWLLNLICDSESVRSAPIVLVEHSSLLDLFELPADGKSRHFAISDLVPKLADFEQRSAAIDQSHAKHTDDERAVLDLAERLDFLSRVMAVFRLPDLTQKESMIESLELSKEMEKRAIPFVVPPKEPGGQWRSLPFALIETHITKETGSEPDPAGDLFAKLIAARRDNDSSAFNTIVEDMAALIGDRNLADCPFEFIVPGSWYEVGTPRLVEQSWFGDTRAFGTTVTSLDLFEGSERLMIRINFFPQGAARKEHIVNDWRLSRGLIPLPVEEIRTVAVDVGGHAGWQVDIETPDDLPIAQEQTRAVGVTLGDQTWVIACSGPKGLMRKHVKEFGQFVASIIIASPVAAETWFSLPKPEPSALPTGTKAVLVTVPDKQTVWLLRTIYVRENVPDEQIDVLKSVLQSIRFRPANKRAEADDPGTRLPFTWALPKGWTLEEQDEGRWVVVPYDQPDLALIELTPLKAEGKWSQTTLVNQWRSGFRLPELLPEEIAADSEQLTIDNRQVVLVVADVP